MKYKTFTATSSVLALMLAAGTAQSAVSSVITDTSTITQLTDYPSTGFPTSEATDPDISKDGSTVVFISYADLTGQGNNPDNLANVFVMNSDGSDLRQLTSATLDPTHLTDIPYYTTAPRVSADGSVVVFASTNDLTGENPPEMVIDPNFPDYPPYPLPNYQIFVMNTDGTGLKQLTHGTGGNSKVPRISQAGDIIAFESTQDLTGDNNDLIHYQTPPALEKDRKSTVLYTDKYVENTKEIFVIKADGNNLTQITKSPPKPPGRNIRNDESRNVSISGDGKIVAFDSFADLIPGGNDDWSNEIFVFDLASYWQDEATVADHTDYTVQVTDTDIDAEFHIGAEDSFEPSLDYDGSTIAFSACINPNGEGILKPDRTILGDNPFLPDVIFYAELDIANRAVIPDEDGNNITQLTFSDDPDAYVGDPDDWTNIDDDAHWPEISDDGRRIVFGSRSRADIINEDNKYEMAMIDLDAPLGPDDAPVVDQLTFNSITSGPYVLQLSFDSEDGARLRPSISADASKIVLRNDSDLTGGNPDEYSEIFMVEPTYINFPSTPDTEETPAEEATNDDNTVVDTQPEGTATDNNNQSTTTDDDANDKSGGAAAFGFAEITLALFSVGGLFLRRRRR